MQKRLVFPSLSQKKTGTSAHEEVESDIECYAKTPVLYSLSSN